MTQDCLSDGPQKSTLLYEGQRVDLYRFVNKNKRLFTKLEFGKTVIAISNLTRENYKRAKAKLEAQVEKRLAEGIDHSDTYKI